MTRDPKKPKMGKIMKYITLPESDLKVSKACLGTMSFGAHVDAETSFAIMDRSLELGVNFFDTAELYSVPPCKETHGLTEKIIGDWFASRGSREKVILATKVVGPSRVGIDYIRGGKTHFDRPNIESALDDSLRRLQTDYIDLYQLHWPDRNVNQFGQREWAFDADEVFTPIAETLEVLRDLQKKGKVRFFGISNETPWGTMEFLRTSREKNLPRMVSVQNNYSLLTRTFETSMNEVCTRENVALLAYSPLGYGVLGGRYLDGARPAGGRFTKYPDFVPRYQSPPVEAIVKKYLEIAEKSGLSLAEMSLAFVYSRDFVASNIIGPSTVEQLEEDVGAAEIKLSSEVLAAIEAVHDAHPNPCA